MSSAQRKSPIGLQLKPMRQTQPAAQPEQVTVTGKGGTPARLQLVKSGDAPAQAHIPQPTSVRPAIAALDVHPLAQLLELEGEFRRCKDIDALRFALVNGAAHLFNADTAFVVEPREKDWKVRAASNVSTIEKHAKRIKQVEAWAATTGTPERPRDAIFSAQLSRGDGVGHAHGANDILWLPVLGRQGEVLAGVILLADQEWTAESKILAGPMLGSVGYVWHVLRGRPPRTSRAIARTLGSRAAQAGLAAVLLAIACIPVPMTVLAPAEVIARDPAVLTAPVDGTVEKFHRAPGTQVAAGDVVVSLENSRQRNALAVARKNVAVAKAQYTKAAQVALVTREDRHAVAVARSQLDVAQAELAFAADQYAKTTITAPQAGTLIYTERSDWTGKPVTQGDRLFEIGTAENIELQIDLDVSDASVQQIGNEVSLFLDGNPLEAVSGKLERVSYRPQLVDQNVMAYRTYASLSKSETLAIGETGVARVSGPTVALWYYLLRRPITYLRQRSGW